MSYLAYLKIPHKHLGRDCKGCDCLGLILLFYKNSLNIALPDYTDYEEHWHLTDAKKVIRLYSSFGFTKTNTVNKYDIILINESGYPKHLAIVLDESYMLHTIEAGTICSEYRQGFWADKIHSVYTRGLHCE